MKSPMRLGQAFVAAAALLQCVSALPTEVLEVEKARITPAPDPTLALQRRGVVSSLTADAGSAADALTSAVGNVDSSILSGLGSAIPSYASDGILPGFVNLPTGDAVLKSAGVNSSELAAVPTQVLNIPGFANWTDNGWNLFLHGNIFKQPNISNATIDKLANQFLIDTNISSLTPSQQDQARNLTRELYVVQQSNESLTVDIMPDYGFPPAGEPNGGGIAPSGGVQTITLPHVTTAEGDFASFIQLANVSGALLPGNGTVPAQRLNLYTHGTDTGNATSYLVSEEGLTFISDIDDILRITKIYEPKQGLLNSFAYPFTQWMNMPDIYRNWSTSLPNAHFHYLTTTPEQITRNYMEFIYNTYPGGSFDDRPLNFSDVSATLSIRKFLLDRVFQTFPRRKFVLVADTSNSDVMRDYPQMVTDFPGQVQCIFLRNTSATDSGDKFPYNTAGFKGLNQSMYMFFKVPEDLTNLDIVNGQCYNSSIPQNVTFKYQGLPLGLSGSGSSSSSSSSSSGSSSGSSTSSGASSSSSSSAASAPLLAQDVWVRVSGYLLTVVFMLAFLVL